MELILESQERKLLLEILVSRLGDLREEIYEKESFHFAAGLKARETLLKGLIEKIQNLPAKPII